MRRLPRAVAARGWRSPPGIDRAMSTLFAPRVTNSTVVPELALCAPGTQVPGAVTWTRTALVAAPMIVRCTCRWRRSWPMPTWSPSASKPRTARSESRRRWPKRSRGVRAGIQDAVEVVGPGTPALHVAAGGVRRHGQHRNAADADGGGAHADQGDGQIPLRANHHRDRAVLVVAACRSVPARSLRVRPQPATGRRVTLPPRESESLMSRR